MDVERIKVKLRRLDTILQVHAPELERIDIFSVDVEGWELEVLAGLDFRKHRPSVLVIENLFDDPAYRARINECGYLLWRFIAPRHPQERFILLGQIGCRIESDAIDPGNVAGPQHGAVVAADVDDDVAGGQRDETFNPLHDLGQRVAHRLIDARLVPVVAVNKLLRIRVAKLNQATGVLVAPGIAPDELKRDLAVRQGRGRAVDHECGCERLIAEADDRS
jgi:hypothetical protein